MDKQKYRPAFYQLNQEGFIRRTKTEDNIVNRDIWKESLFTRVKQRAFVDQFLWRGKIIFPSQVEKTIYLELYILNVEGNYSHQTNKDCVGTKEQRRMLPTLLLNTPPQPVVHTK